RVPPRRPQAPTFPLSATACPTPRARLARRRRALIVENRAGQGSCQRERALGKNNNQGRGLMSMIGRVFALVCAALGFAAPAAADDYPSRPIRLMVGFAAGGPTDILARVMAQLLTQRLGQQVIVENRPGGGGNTATEAVINAAPDGYTVLVIATANAINTS